MKEETRECSDHGLTQSCERVGANPTQMPEVECSRFSTLSETHTHTNSRAALKTLSRPAQIILRGRKIENGNFSSALVIPLFHADGFMVLCLNFTISAITHLYVF